MSSDAAPALLAVEITIDCADAVRLAAFWKTAVGYVEHGDPGAGTAWLTDPRKVAPHLCLIEVPEPKRAKNRVHLDLAVSGRGTAEQKWLRIVDEASRLHRAGATFRTVFEGRWISMADPEGNEFDVC